MRLNGAPKPQGAFQHDGCSIGARYRKKYNHNDNNICDNRMNTDNNLVKQTNNNHSNNHISFSPNNNIIQTNSSFLNDKFNRKTFGYSCTTLSRQSLPINSRKMMRFQQSTVFRLIFILNVFNILCLLPYRVLCDDVENEYYATTSVSSGPPEFTTPKFDPNRGNKKFGDKCESTQECGFERSICDEKKKSCQCIGEFPVTNHLDKCGKVAPINETCFFNEQCETFHPKTICRDNRCVCLFEMSPFIDKEGKIDCKGEPEKRGPDLTVDPAMIMILVVMALMFIIICVVLRLFSRARWSENRTIFNTPNPRLMNVSLLRDNNKLLHGGERRGSRMSVRVPSRQPSMASLRPHSPNPSLGSRRSSKGSSNASATSTRSNRSTTGLASNNYNNEMKNDYPNPSQQPLVTHITTNPAVESVAVEIFEPK